MEIRKPYPGGVDQPHEAGKRVTFVEVTTAASDRSDSSCSSTDIIEPPEEFRV
jgi:hypothetical protein